MKESMVRILRPNFPSHTDRAWYIPQESDYVTVPRLSVYGTYQILELASLDTVGKLAVLANRMEEWRKRNEKRSSRSS